MEAFNFGPTLTPQTLERFLVHCSNNEVSDILLQGGDKIWVERHGRQLPMTSYPLDNLELERTVDKVFGQEIKGTLKSAAVVNTAIQLRGDEAGTIGLGRGETRRFRANFTQADIYKTEAAMSLTLRVLNEVIPQLKQMGIEPDLFNSLLPAAGLGLICGETGSGKSTLMASIFQYCGETYQDRKIITVEDPIEYRLGSRDWIAPAPAQSQIGRDIDSFRNFITLSGLRRSPKIMGVGELLNRLSFEAAVLAGKSGHFCLGTLHVKTVGEAISRSLQNYPPEMREAAAFDLLSILSYIIVQRLLKTKDGRRKAVREYLVIDNSLRRKLYDVDYSKWGRYIDDLLIAENRSLIQNAWAMHQEGLIDEAEVIEVAGYMDYLALKEGKYGH
ncbi:TPA: plasmid transfer ATPase TraJ [Enterobacter hormaechei]|nr:plasmid transfer ATPase TraJ [Enterobacter hormaechei]